MKYIRTKDGIYKLIDFLKTDGLKCANHYGYTKDGTNYLGTLKHFNKYKQADTIEELCDVFIRIKDRNNYRFFSTSSMEQVEGWKNYGAIWTDKGLIFVAKMNSKGELELL